MNWMTSATCKQQKMKALIHTFLLFAVMGLLSACTKEEAIIQYSAIQAHFEGLNNADELLQGPHNWESFGISRARNNAAIVSDTFYSGNAAMRFHAETNQPNGVSSSALNSNENLFLREEMVFSVDCRIMIPSYSSSNNLEIMRLEANDSADDPSGVSFFLDEDGALSLNRSAMGLSNIDQEIGTKTAFPTNQWVNVHIDSLADARSRGYVKIWQDEVLVLEALSTETMPKAKLHLSEKGKNYFSKLSFGILSNGSGLPTTLFLDDLSVWSWG
jgi:hypothetical protein